MTALAATASPLAVSAQTAATPAPGSTAPPASPATTTAGSTAPPGSAGSTAPPAGSATAPATTAPATGATAPATTPAATTPAATAPATTAPATGATAPATTTTAATTPAATTPAATTPAATTPAATTPAHPAAAPVPWRGTLFFATLSANLNVFDPSLQLTQNPTVDMTLSIRPRFFLNRQFQLRAGANLLYEFTNSDSTSTVNEVRFSDTFFDLWYHGIPALGPVRLWVAPRIILPTSLESIARTMIFTPGLVVQAAAAAEHVAGGELDVIANVTYTHPVYQYTTPGLRAAPPYRPQCYGLAGDSCGLQVSGLPNTSDSLTWSLIVTQDWGWISPGVFFAMTHAFSYGLPVTPDVGHITDPQTVRNLTSFALWVDLIPTPYLAFEVGYSMTRNILDANGQYGNPLFSQYQDMRLYLQTIVTLDRLYEALFVHQRTHGGVIRTQNEPRRSRNAGIYF